MAAQGDWQGIQGSSRDRDRGSGAGTTALPGGYGRAWVAPADRHDAFDPAYPQHQRATPAGVKQRGTLRVGDSIIAGDTYGRVRRMVDEYSNDVKEAGPSRPVQVQGLNGVPGAGDNLLVVEDDRVARQIAKLRDRKSVV